MIAGNFVASAIIAYLLGSIPSGLIIARYFGKVDVTKHGSGNIGSTNVLRTVGTKAALFVMVLDLGKGALAVYLSRVIIGDSVIHVAGFPLDTDFAQTIAALMAMVGHNWSIFMKFKGGKGVATYIGGWLAISPWEGTVVGFTGGVAIIIAVAIWRHMSRGSIIGSLVIWLALVPMAMFHGFPIIYLVYALVATAIILWQHRGNIRRLRRGTELRFKSKTGKPDT
jgi:glycerol-3-phosphate acyltransferase PlsY